MSNARLWLAFVGEAKRCGLVRMLAKIGFPRPLPLVRFADKALRAFPGRFPTPRPESGR